MVKHFTKILLCALWNSRENELLETANVPIDTNQRLIREVANFWDNFSSSAHTVAMVIWRSRRSRPSRICEQKWTAKPSKQLKNNTFFITFSWQGSKLFQLHEIILAHHVNVAKWALSEWCMSWKWKWGMVVVLKKHRHMYVWTFPPQLMD